MSHLMLPEEHSERISNRKGGDIMTAIGSNLAGTGCAENIQGRELSTILNPSMTLLLHCCLPLARLVRDGLQGGSSNHPGFETAQFIQR